MSSVEPVRDEKTQLGRLAVVDCKQAWPCLLQKHMRTRKHTQRWSEVDALEREVPTMFSRTCQRSARHKDRPGMAAVTLATHWHLV